VRPILLKISPDITDEQLEEIVEVATEQSIAGIIATNTTISRAELKTSSRVVTALGDGGISGAPVRARALQIINRIYKLTNGKMPIIGVGGIFSAADAWQAIIAGASLVQLYTGFIYGGPMIALRINRGLSRLLREHALHNLDQAVGLSHRQSE